MGFLKNFFGKKEAPLESYEDFWNWFASNEKDFYQAVKQRNNIEKNFFNKLSPKLDEVKPGIYFLTGMFDDNTVELILSAEGNAKHVVFAEEFIASAPTLKGWKFTALKPAMDMEKLSIDMAGHTFSSSNMNFYANEMDGYPDEIDITIVHDDYTEENEEKLTNGVYVFLDNALGELDFLETIDNLSFSSKENAVKELIPITKLKDFLKWRQKEFVEKYEGIRHDTENDSYSNFEGQLENGNYLIGVINSDILQWDSKASHPWMLKIKIDYDGSKTNGLSDQGVSSTMNEMEDDAMQELKDADGYLNIGRITGNNKREIFFACKDFRKPSKVMHQLQREYAGKLDMEFEIFKDKYWQSVERFAS